MESKTGRARFDGKKLHFDDIGWAMVKKCARKAHKSPKQVVIAALYRAAKMGLFNEKSKVA